MADPIKVGDLVMVVRSCCGDFVRSPVFVVDGLWEPRLSCRCAFCDSALPRVTQATDRTQNGIRYGIPLPWLRKIDPPALPESVERDTEVPA